MRRRGTRNELRSREQMDRNGVGKGKKRMDGKITMGSVADAPAFLFHCPRGREKCTLIFRNNADERRTLPIASRHAEPFRERLPIVRRYNARNA